MSLDYKNLFSALLGFSATLFVLSEYGAAITRNGNSYYVPLFLIVLVSTVLLEIVSKYQGKLCETLEGVISGFIAVMGFALYMFLLHQGYVGMAVVDATSGAQGVTHSVLVAGLLVGAFIFIWKSYLKPGLGISTRFCDGGEQHVMVTRPGAEEKPITTTATTTATIQK